MGRLLIKSPIVLAVDTWSEFKKYFNGVNKNLILQYNENTDGYEFFLLDSQIIYTFFLYHKNSNKPGINNEENDANVDDFLDNYQAAANKRIVNEISIKQYDLINPITASTIEHGFVLDCNINDITSELFLQFPYPIDILGGRCYSLQAVDGDYLNVVGMDMNDTPIGIITSNSNSGNTTLEIPTEITPYLKPGYLIKIGTENKDYTIASVSGTTLTLLEPLTDNKLANDTIHLRVPFAIRKWLNPNSEIDIGLVVFEVKGITSNMKIKITYFHKIQLTEEKHVRFTLIYRF